MLNPVSKRKMITKHIILNGQINMDLVTAFCDAANTPYFDQNNVIRQFNYCIYLTSCGGFVEGEQIIKNIINMEPHRFRLIANGEISSSAFQLFFDANCDKTIMPGTYGMFHLSRIPVEINQMGDGHSECDRFQLKHFTKEGKAVLKWCESVGMNDKEIQQIASTTDVYFSTDRLKEMIVAHQRYKEESNKMVGAAITEILRDGKEA
jgi:hypothetical protein